MYLRFSLISIQLSAVEIRLVFPHAKLIIPVSWLQWLEKRWGAHANWWALAIFQLTELNIKANPPCLQCACIQQVCTKWCHKLCTERMCNANVRNHLKLKLLSQWFFKLLHVVPSKLVEWKFCLLIQAYGKICCLENELNCHFTISETISFFHRQPRRTVSEIILNS